MMFEIKRIDQVDQECVRVIRDSFMTVAMTFSLTKENAPTNAAFIELDALTALQQKGAQMYGGYCDGRPIGFVAVRKAGTTCITWRNWPCCLPSGTGVWTAAD